MREEEGEGYVPWKALLSASQSCAGDGTTSGILSVAIFFFFT